MHVSQKRKYTSYICTFCICITYLSTRNYLAVSLSQKREYSSYVYIYIAQSSIQNYDAVSLNQKRVYGLHVCIDDSEILKRYVSYLCATDTRRRRRTLKKTVISQKKHLFQTQRVQREQHVYNS